jgi:prepilin-type N-terminal cleavage/methylation domain-containing protein
VNRQHGFTLIETAIVTIIVGLLIGGILRGQEMVVQAKTKSLITDFTGITAAVQAYRDRYRALPGDDSSGSGRWVAYGAKSGNGDGIVGGAYNAAAPAGDPATSLTINTSTGAGESLNFWWHMRLSGFVSGPQQGPGAANQPDNTVGGILGVETVQTGGAPAGFLTGLVACTSNVIDKNAIGLDAQLDDLEPAQGQIRALLQSPSSTNPSLTDPSNTFPSSYTEGLSNRYLVCRSL